MKWAGLAIASLIGALVAQAYEFHRLEQHPDYYLPPPTEEEGPPPPCNCWCPDRPTIREEES